MESVNTNQGMASVQGILDETDLLSRFRVSKRSKLFNFALPVANASFKM